jgi:predicted permease
VGPDDEKQDDTNMSTVFAAAGASVGVFLVASLGGAIFFVRKKRQSGSNAANHQVATSRHLTPPGLTPQSSYKGAQMAVPRPPPGFDF